MWTLRILAFFVFYFSSSVLGFSPQRSLPVSVNRADSALLSSIIAAPSESYFNDIDRDILTFVGMGDDDERRKSFESFVLSQIKEELKSFAGLQIKDLPFVRDVDASLARLGQAVQDKAWDNYVVAGFNDQPDVYESGELWVLVDMLIQFKVQIKGLDKNSKITTLMKEKKCGQCSVCSCKKDVKVEYQ